MKNDNEAELRLALVCYGGVSLAVYMHGVTKELHKLIRASRRFNEHPAENPFRGGSEAVYFEALKDLAAAGRRVDVSIDIIGGASAGGINGVALSKALAQDADLEPLTKIWIEEGDFRKLLRAPSFAGLHAQVAMDLVAQLANLFKPRSPLRGERMSELLLSALRDMDQNPDTSGLLRSDGKLQLFVTATDLTGFEVLVPSGAGGASQRDAYSAQVFEFHGEPGDLTHFGPEYTATLAFAGRATASFPGAFAPIGQKSFQAETREPHLALHTNVFRYDYPDPERAESAVFVDGGVLNNAPFDVVIDAIGRRSAETQVYRRLVYIQPDPGRRLDEMANQTVSQDRRWLPDLWAVSGVRGSHPIVLDLLKLRDMNWRIAEVAAIADRQMNYVQMQIAEARKAMTPHVGATVPRGSAESQRAATAETLTEIKAALGGNDDVQELSDKLHKRAELALGPAWQTYQRLKFEATARRLAVELAFRFGFPHKSGRASFGRAAMLAWAQRTADWIDGGDALSEELRATDVPYRERRLMFIIAGINDLYPKDGPNRGAPPPRESLDSLKTQAWGILTGLRVKTKNVVQALPQEKVEFLSDFDNKTMLDKPEDFALQRRSEFDALFDAYRVALAGVLGNDSARLWEEFRKGTATWTNEEAEQELLSRYLGFPLWDGMIFPTITLTELPQFTPIGVSQFSPLEARALTAVDEHGNEVPKLQGIPLHHFGAFLDRKARENDYLWGRLDGAELILRTLRDVAPQTSGAGALGRLGDVLTAVLDSERGLKKVPQYLWDHLDKQVKELTNTDTR
ncbi:patatin-like protein [Mycobacterium sp.]|uniref:patatin-like protein n=1 Tax=Mycobacterium sp. TaxID=1785 RepID=UPI002DB2CB30|nr:patatin-like protein [Mycobacterium sp.]